ncbi:endolytic transglycosylase MltG [Selenomonas ruminantium]|uniref:endolytic transglycosylase MltG n=1 Tax=Selenomonas ruminantium TaxID=971 RepID=UPI0026F1260F|nr:endolytic transglycosylase MltG [Selenomonas ruminantium]
MGDLLAKIGEFKDKLGKWLNGEDVELGNIHDEMKKGTDFFHQLTWKHWTAIGTSFVVVIALAVVLAFNTTDEAAPRNLDPNQTIFLAVKKGMSASDITDELLKHGIITNKKAFWLQVKKSDAAGNFKTGTYAFKPNTPPEDIIAKLVAGETTQVKFTIPEGFGVKEIAKRLDDEGLVDEQEFLAKAKIFAPYSYIEQDKDIRYACEGFLFPDTYILHDEPSVDGILQMMAEDFDQRLTPKMRKRAAELNLSIHDLITLASLVEKEAMYEEDRPIIAQVFFKRLKIGMPLQTDTTIQYLLDAPKEDVSIKDTKIESPYNTYQIKGLPPGPIASPGMAAIEAVLYPADTDYLYFVADRQGHNHYSKSYAEHQQIVEQVR